MRKIFSATLILSLFIFSSCKEDPIIDTTGDLEINFTAEYGGEPLVIYRDYTFPESELRIRFQKFQYYLSDVSLITDGSSDVTILSEIELLEAFNNHDTDEKAELGEGRKYETIPTGTYSGLRMGIGVSNELNVRNTEYPLSHPLGKNFWDGWSSYIFAKIEGNMDVNADGEYGTESAEKFVLHTGSNTVYQTITFPEPIVISDNANTLMNISVDVKDLFTNTEGELYDIINENTTHDPASLESGLFLMENFNRAMVVE